MATAGSVVVDLLLRSGAFDTDIQRSTKAAEKRMKEMERTFNDVGTKIGAAFAGYFSVQKIRELINGLDALNNVAAATGASIENISALEDVALRTGSSFETVGNALVKFNESLKNTDPNSKAAEALKMIGLNLKDLRELDPAEALRRTAQALAGFADDGNKARLVQELFGKSTKEVGQFLQDLGTQSQLVAKVTAEEAKQAQAFNGQLQEMAKNSQDLARSLVSDLLPQLNEALKLWREGEHLTGLQTLLTGTDTHKAQQEIAGLTEQILTVQNTIDQARAKVKEGGIGGWLAGLNLPGYEKKLAELNERLRQTRALLTVNQPNFFGGDTGPKAKVGQLPDKNAKDPDADFKAYLNNLQQQIQKVNELTVSEKLLDDIRRGSLTVTDDQKKKLMQLAATVDATTAKHKAWNEQMKDGRQRAIEEGDALQKSNEEWNKRLQTLLAATPDAQLKTRFQDVQLLVEATQLGAITADQARQAFLAMGSSVQENTRLADEFGSVFGNALEGLVTGGQSFNDVLKQMMLSVANLILKVGVIEPMVESLRASMKAGGFLSGLFGSGGGGGIGGISGGGGFGPSSASFGGARAGGGPVSSGMSYLVGERGPEMFVPRTAGMVVPNGGGAGGAPTIINQTTGRVDNVVQQQLPGGGKALILQELATQFANPNSVISRSLQTNYRLRPAR